MKKHFKNKNRTQKAESLNFLLKYSYLLIIIIPLVVLLPSVKNSFVYFDDDILILENQAKISNLENIANVFQTDAFLNNSSPYYRPMMNVSFIFDAQIAKANPGFYHFMNLFYHILCCLSLLWLLQLLGFSKEKAFIGALIFSVHPLMSSAVFWIPARGDLLVSLFGLLFFALSIYYLNTRKYVALGGAALCFAVALFSKESAIVLPLLLVFYIIVNKKGFVRSFMLFGFVALVMVAWSYLRYKYIHMIGSEQLGFHALINNLPFPFEIIASFFSPIPLVVTPRFSAYYTGFGIILALAIFIAFYRQKGERSYLFFLAVAWYIAFSLPNMFVWLNTTPDSYEYLLHRAYLPIIGLIISVLAVLPEKYIKLNRRSTLLSLSLIILFFSVTSIMLSRKYKDPATFWNSAIDSNPNQAWFYHFLGRYYFKQKDYKVFEEYTRKAILLKEDPRFLYHMGLIYFLEKKQYDTAFLYFNRARAMGFNETEANKNYFDLCIMSAGNFFVKGDYKKAIERCQIGINIMPANAIAAYNMGLYLVYAGEIKRASSWWRRSLLLDPELKQAYRSLYLYYLKNTTMHDSVDYYSREYQKRGGVLDDTSR